MQWQGKKNRNRTAQDAEDKHDFSNGSNEPNPNNERMAPTHHIYPKEDRPLGSYLDLFDFVAVSYIRSNDQVALRVNPLPFTLVTPFIHEPRPPLWLVDPDTPQEVVLHRHQVQQHAVSIPRRHTHDSTRNSV